MVVVSKATVVDDDLGAPVRKRARIQFDFVRKENFPLVRQSDDTTKTFDDVMLLNASGR